MGDFLKSAFGYIGNQVIGKPENEFVGQYIEVGNLSLRVKRVLAEGGFAVVFEAQDTASGKEYALKRLISHDEETSKGILHEIAVLKKLSGHPNIVEFISAASVGKEKARHIGTEFLIVTELCRGGQLVDLLRARGKPFPCNMVLHMFYQMCRAVQHMHKQTPPIIHRDLKVENFLLDNKCMIKLCDFGSCTTEGHSPDPSWSALRRGQVQEEIEKNTTPMYRAPEMLDLYQNYPIDQGSDVWALGCVLYLLCFHQHPFEDSAKLAIINANYNIPANDTEYRCFHNLLRMMLSVDPRSRPYIGEVANELQELGLARQVKLTSPIPFDEDMKRSMALSMAEPEPKAAETPPRPAPVRPSAPASNQQSVPQRPASQPPSRPTPPPRPPVAPQGAGASGMMGFLKGGAGNLMRNIKDASSKVMETVSASINKGEMDFNYITSRIAVMSFPAEGAIETMTRNHIEDVQAFLDTRHPKKYAVYNLSQRPHRADRFDGRLSQRGFEGNSAPELRVLVELCVNLAEWLCEGKQNVAVVHCLDGKAGSGTVVCALMCFCRLFDQAPPALQLFAARRCNPQLQPSQLRYIDYICRLVSPEPEMPHHKPVMLVNITLRPVPLFNKMKNGCRPYVEVFQGEKKIFSTLQDYETMKAYTSYDGQILIPLNGVSATGDVTVAVFHARSTLAGKIASIKICQMQFYTGFIPQDQIKLNFARNELDHLDTPDKYVEGFSVTMEILVSPNEKPRTGKSKAFPWEDLPRSLMKRRILFMEKDELQQVVRDFGRYNKEAALRGERTTSESSDMTSTNDKQASPKQQQRQSKPPQRDFFSTLEWNQENDQGQGSSAGDDEALDSTDHPASRQTSNQLGGVADLLGFGDQSAQQTQEDTGPPTSENNFTLLDLGGEADSSKANVPRTPSNFDLLAGGAPVPHIGVSSGEKTDDLLGFTGWDSSNTAGAQDAFDPFAEFGQPTQNTGASNATTSSEFDAFNLFDAGNSQPTTAAPSSSMGGGLLPNPTSSGGMTRNANSANSLPAMASVGTATINASKSSDPFASFDPFGTKKTEPLNQMNKSPSESPVHQAKPPMGSGYHMGGSHAPPPTAASRSATSSPLPHQQQPSYNRAHFAPTQGSGVRPKVDEGAFQDLLGGFGGTGGGGGAKGNGRTIKEMRKELMAKETDPEKMKVLDWVEGKERNIRALICSLNTMLWDGVRWKGVNMAELVTVDHVKRQYKNAVRAIHPDKWMGTPYENISKMIVIELNDAMTEFEREKEAAENVGRPAGPMF